MLFSVCVVLSVLYTSVKKKFVEKLSLSIVLKKIVICVKIRFLVMNIMSRDGPQIRDGYLVCGTCYDKLGADNEICKNCFCISCYAASDEFCDCALPNE